MPEHACRRALKYGDKSCPENQIRLWRRTRTKTDIPQVSFHSDRIRSRRNSSGSEKSSSTPHWDTAAFVARSSNTSKGTALILSMRHYSISRSVFTPGTIRQIAKSAVCGSCYNHRETRWISHHLPRGGTFVDIGANMGFFSLYAAQRDARVIAIEPNRTLFDRLTTNMALNGLKADLFQVAVGDHVGAGLLVQTNKDFGSGRMGEDGPGDRVHVRPLLDILYQCDVTAIHVLKIDIEGYEDRALLPFFRDAPVTLLPDHIIMEDTESARWTQDVFPVLRRAGYERRGRSRGNILLSSF
ncbi:FkbM family methyltransferase [Gluconobacter japonicus]|uniref:FkbM family methyltransferase n=1 Tax=Gluconobacter japonicus TaxID=376620 RepID=UPI000AC075A8|nr:FkbM family methyltransferase [Gluconobacter japonicus]